MGDDSQRKKLPTFREAIFSTEMTLSEVADALKIDRATMSKVSKGKIRPRRERRKEFERILGTEIDWDRTAEEGNVDTSPAKFEREIAQLRVELAAVKANYNQLMDLQKQTAAMTDRLAAENERLRVENSRLSRQIEAGAPLQKNQA